MIPLHPLHKINRRGTFITFEGGEGAGKSTLIERLANQLSKDGYSTLVTREPGGSSLGELIRTSLLSHNKGTSFSSLAELLLFLAARAQHIEEKIEPALKLGKVVLCDRFNDSSIAYQGHARGLGMERVQDLCRMVTQELKPDLTLYLDVNPEIGLERTRKTMKDNAAAGEMDRIESEELAFHHRVRGGFKLIAAQEPTRFHLIDAHRTPNAVFEDALHLIYEKLPKRWSR